MTFDNPAAALRAALAPSHPRGMLRWDASGASLLVSDAPRRADGGAFAALVRSKGLCACIKDNLLYIDLPVSAYEELTRYDFYAPGPWSEGWFAEQALLNGILARPKPAVSPGAAPDQPLLRAAMLACAQGLSPVRRFLHALRAHDARALRGRNMASCRACAALCAHFLFAAQGVGLPPFPSAAHARITPCAAPPQGPFSPRSATESGRRRA